MASKSKVKGNAKSQKSKAKAKKRSPGAPFNEQDPKRRLGNYEGAGEAPRKGGRTSGIVGQTKQRNKTDKNLKRP
jgi:hypothetical protein